MKVKVSMRYIVKITESRTVIPKSNGEGDGNYCLMGLEESWRWTVVMVA